jgi:carbonic anhydrase
MSAPWGYGKTNGVSTWVKVAPDAAGKRQSPIAIDSKAAAYDENLQKMPLYVNVPISSKQTYEPSKHGFHLALNGDNSCLKGGPLAPNQEYVIAQFHFHWSGTNDEGSEHTLDGKKFASEAHFVFFNKEKYKTFEQAAKSDGLAVLGFFIKPGTKDNALFKPLFDAISAMKTSGFKKDELKAPLEMNLILSQVNHQKYYTYPGSLTTPPCLESVRWIVFHEPIEFSNTQLNLLRATHPGVDCCEGAKHNYRPPCPLNDRKVSASFRI